jgi:hypothetical protein
MGTIGVATRFGGLLAPGMVPDVWTERHIPMSPDAVIADLNDQNRFTVVTIRALRIDLSIHDCYKEVRIEREAPDRT